MFLQENKDILFSGVAFSLIDFVRKIDNSSVKLTEEEGKYCFHDWFKNHKTTLDELGFTTIKSAWCWARMIEKNLDHKQPRRPLPSGGKICEYCKVAKAEEVDHIWPLSLGGPVDERGRNLWNFVYSCCLCNSIKGNAPIACTVKPHFLQGLVSYALEIYGPEF